MTTHEDIKTWFERGEKICATHMIVMCDTFDYEDYPIYVLPGEDAKETAEFHNETSMQRLMEVYNLALPIEPQLIERFCFNY